MIEIELLPLELREKKRLSLEGIFKTRQAIFVLGGLVLLHLFLHTVTAITTKRLNRLERNWQGLSSEKAQIDQVKAELIQINEKIPLIEQLISKRVLWSKKLNRISDLIISGIWINQIALEKRKVPGDEPLTFLIIRGSAASRTKEEPALIGRFMQSLKADPSFSADFAGIELGPIKKRQISQTEVMDFILICRFKEQAQFRP